LTGNEFCKQNIIQKISPLQKKSHEFEWQIIEYEETHVIQIALIDYT
jgi:hypothetical protein